MPYKIPPRSSLEEYEEHLELAEFDSTLKAAPQSFCYLGRY